MEGPVSSGTKPLGRHDNLSKRTAQNLTCPRASVTQEDLRKWFLYIQDYLQKKNLFAIEPHRIFNLDESAFMLIPKDNSVIAEKGSKSVYQITGNDKACITVLFNASASGKLTPPMILFTLKKPPTKKVLNEIPTGWGIGYSERGWMTAETFYCYLTNIFYKWLQNEKIEFPVIVYVDRHSSHITLPVVKFCEENMIELIALYPNATHIIQPLDVSFFHPLKDQYAKVRREWRIENNIINFQKHMFASVLKMTLDSTDLANGIKNGFRACGLYPFNPAAVNYDVLNKKKKQKDNQAANISSANEKSKTQEHLDYFEDNILSPSLLEAFQMEEFSDSWNGDLKQEELFESWRKMRKLCTNEQNAQYFETKSENIRSISSDLDITPMCNVEDITCTSNSNNSDIVTKKSLPRIISVEVIKEVDSFVEQTVNNEECGDIFIDRMYCDDGSDIHTFGNNDFPTTDVIENSTFDFFDESGEHKVASIVAIVPDSQEKLDLSPDAVELETIDILNEKTGNLPIFNEVPKNLDNNILELSNNVDDEILDLSTSTCKSYFSCDTTTSEAASTLVNSLQNNEKENIMYDGDDALFMIDNEIKMLPSDKSTSNNSNTSDDMKKFFPEPNFTEKKKKKTATSDIPKGSTREDILERLQKKEDEKKLKEKQILDNKKERERLKEKKEKEQLMQKEFQECQKKLLQEKKDLNSEIKNIKKMLNSKNNKENKIELQEQLNSLIKKLEEVEKSLILSKMQSLQNKMKIKEEKI